MGRAVQRTRERSGSAVWFSHPVGPVDQRQVADRRLSPCGYFKPGELLWIMDPKVRDLLGISLLSFGSLCLAWARGADLFAMAFAASMVIAGFEAIRSAR